MGMFSSIGKGWQSMYGQRRSTTGGGGGGTSPYANYGQGSYSGFNPEDYFGAGTAQGNQNKPYSGNPWEIANAAQEGSGIRGLPSTFKGWKGPARYAIGQGANFVQQTNPIADYFKTEMGKDYQGQLYGMSSDASSTALSDASTMQKGALSRAGYGGGSGGVSPFAALSLQNEAQARSGALGDAARQSVFLAQQMRSTAAINFGNILGRQNDAMMRGAYIQAGGQGPQQDYDDPSAANSAISGGLQGAAAGSALGWPGAIAGFGIGAIGGA